MEIEMQAAEQHTVLRFPTKRKRPYPNPRYVERGELPANAVAIQPPRPERSLFAHIQRTPELALVLSLLSALEDGDEQEQALFRRVRREVNRNRTSHPQDQSLLDADNLLDAIVVVNHGR
jgi:hypothetical protein